MRYGRIYNDLWPLNVSGFYCADMTVLIKDRLDQRYPDGWEANTHMLLVTDRYPYFGKWHRDAPPYEEDTIALLCLAGFDELEYGIGYCQRANLLPGQSLLLPAATPHRGRCSTHRITYHCRVGPKGKVMPESPMDTLPPMSIKRFIRRTYYTLKYYLCGL